MADKIIDINLNPNSPKLLEIKERCFDSKEAKQENINKLSVIGLNTSNTSLDYVTNDPVFLNDKTLVTKKFVEDTIKGEVVGSAKDYRTWSYNFPVGDNIIYKVTYNWEDASTDLPVGGKIMYFKNFRLNASDSRIFVIDQFQTVSFVYGNISSLMPEILILQVSATGISINVFQKGTNPTAKGNIISLEKVV